MKAKQIKVILAAILLMFSVGCTDIHYEGPDGTKIDYSRKGPQQLDNVCLEFPDGATLCFDKQEADIGEVIDAFTAFLQTLKR